MTLPSDGPSTEDAARRAVVAVWHIESARLIAGLARLTGDVGMAEDLAQDALEAALRTWPRTGVPPNPGGWLVTPARRRAIERHRRGGVHERALAVLAADAADHPGPDDAVVDAVDDHLHDDLLRLVLTVCHPVLPATSRVPLALRCLAGLTTAEVARALLLPEATVAQRIVRAKRLLAERGVRFELPPPAELPERLPAVLEVAYLVFNEGYAATSGADWTRQSLVDDGVRLARRLAVLLPAHSEVHALAALLELQASRIPARTAPDGDPVLLADQDRRRWDRLLIRRGLAALGHARERATAAGSAGPYLLQAEIAACHARAGSVEATDWSRVAALYGALERLWPTPVVRLNRAVAVGMAHSAAAGLAVLDAVEDEASLARYPYLHAARGDLLRRAGDAAAAEAAFRRAAELTGNDAERRLFLRQAERVVG